MRKQYLNPKQIVEPRFYTHTVTLSGGVKLIYVSGQVSYDRGGRVLGKGDMRAQAEQVFSSLSENLKAAGAGWGDVIKMNGYMVGMNPESVNQYREVRLRHLDPGKLPASTLVGVERLVHEELLLEVEVIAALPDAPVAARAGKSIARKRRKR